MYELCSHVVNSMNNTTISRLVKTAILSTSNFTTSLSVNRTNIPSCGVPTYLRSGVGGAPLPCVIAIVLFLVNISNVVVRIKKFEAAQTFSMVLSFAMAFVVTLAYVSTGLAPEMIMVWTPILLVGNAGSLLQVFVFVIEKNGSRWPRLGRREAQGGGGQDLELSKPAFHNPEALQALTAGLHSRSRRLAITKTAITKADNSKTDILILTLSFLLALWIVTLQIVGITYAWLGLQVPTPSVAWCSPVFFHRLAVLSSECDFYPITEDGPKGIGCISLPPSLQRIWLLVTIIFGGLSLLFEAFDVVLLVYFTTNQSRATPKWPGGKHDAKFTPAEPSKLKRPWFTMVFGLMALFVVSTLAVYQAIYQPKGITSHVLVFGDRAGSEVCETALTVSSLRGEIIAWADGLFNAWGCSYYGCV